MNTTVRKALTALATVAALASFTACSPTEQDKRDLERLLAEGESFMAEAVEESGGTTPTDYDRDAFGPAWYDWDQNGCGQRDDVLARDLTDVVLDEDGCTVLFGTLDDPYSGQVWEFERGHSNTDIDHVVPLSYAWAQGANEWTEAERTQFANDFNNLNASYMGENRSKGDKGPSEWLPSNTEYHCAYVTQFLTVAYTYDLTIPPADAAVQDRVC